MCHVAAAEHFIEGGYQCIKKRVSLHDEPKNIRGRWHFLSCLLFLFRPFKLLRFTMDAAKDREYSTLEVTPHDGKQVSVAVGTEHIVDDGGIEVVAKEDSYAHEFGYHRVQAHPPSRKKWILFGGTVGLVLTLAAVLGIVFGLRHKRPATTSLTSPSNSSAISSLAISPRRNIAAISFASNNTRVYFQDDMGQIMEAANSADDPTWNIKRIGVGGKNGSAIAAAVSQPDFPLASHVYFNLNHSY